MDEADGHRLDAGVPELAHPLPHLALVERDEDLAVGDDDTLIDGEAVPALDERPRLPGQLLLEREVERLLVAGDVEDVAHPLGGDEPDLGAAVRERDVRRDRRAVEQVVDLGETDACLRAELPDALAGAASRVVRRRRDLVDRDPARLLVDEDQVGERAPDVDADSLHGLLRSALRVCAPGAFGAKRAAPVTVPAQFGASSVTVRAQCTRFFAIR